MEVQRAVYNKIILRHDLIRDEGVRLAAYKDSVGLWTVGIGHLVGKAEPIDPFDDRPRMSRVTQDEAEALLDLDIKRAESVLDKVLTAWMGLEDVRVRALLNMAFNLGHRLDGFPKFLAAIQAKNWVTAGMELRSSLWAKQLPARSSRVIHAIETGVDA